MTTLESIHISSRFIPKTNIYPKNPLCRNSNIFFSFPKHCHDISISSSSITSSDADARCLRLLLWRRYYLILTGRCVIRILFTTMPSRKCFERCSLSSIAPLEAILFDIDGTLCDSDPFHYNAFREMLREICFNNGEPITEEFFLKDIHGKHNDELCRVLFPDWDLQKAQKFMEDKEAYFRRLVAEQLQPLAGLTKLGKWIEERGLKRAAVTNAPRPNAELMISILGLDEFFEAVVIASECERAKPFPDPYLKGLQALQASPGHTFVFEDSVSGIKAGMAAGMLVVGVASRNSEKSLKDAGATLVIKDFEDSRLWAALEELEISLEALQL